MLTSTAWRPPRASCKGAGIPRSRILFVVALKRGRFCTRSWILLFVLGDEIIEKAAPPPDRGICLTSKVRQIMSAPSMR